jgi:hypothetical protein
MEPFRIYISATQYGKHSNGTVAVGYAMRIIGNGVDRIFSSDGREGEVQAMYACGLHTAYDFLWTELPDEISNSEPEVEVVVRKPNMRVRFRDADTSLEEKSLGLQPTATSNIDIWIDNSVMSTHFPTSFRVPNADENVILKDIEKRAQAEAYKRSLADQDH